MAHRQRYKTHPEKILAAMVAKQLKMSNIYISTSTFYTKRRYFVYIRCH